MQVKVLILRAPGINRDADAATAIELAGGLPERIHVNRLVDGSVQLADFAMLIVPGGFSYGDHLGAGKLLAVDLAHRLGEQIAEFVASGRPVIGICNGFQVLVKAGVLPGAVTMASPGSSNVSGIAESPLALPGSANATLTDNRSGSFECRWVVLQAEARSRCVFTEGMTHPIEVPVAHGEGRFVAADPAALAANGQVALRYVTPTDDPLSFPANPNGSDAAIAGVCNAQGNVLGLMPHPENAVWPHQHPRWTREARRTEGEGLAIFRNAVRYARR